MIKKVKSILSKTNKRSQNSLLIFFFLPMENPTFFFTKAANWRFIPGYQNLHGLLMISLLHLELFPFQYSIFFSFKNWALSPLIIMSWIILWLGHCNCACSYSLIGCGILIGLWLSHTPFGRKLPTFLLCLINLYLLLSALFATKWCVPSA